MGTKKKKDLRRFNRENILDTAKKLFQQKGVSQTTMDDIAREADYSKSTIYVYFKSKDEIYNSIVLEYMQLMKQGFSNCTSTATCFEECYFAICSMLSEFQFKYPLYFESILGEISVTQKDIEEDDVLREIYETGEGINSLIQAALQKGIEEKYLRPDLQIMPTVFTLWASLCGIISLADKKRKYFSKNFDMDYTTFLQYGFKTILKSIVY